MTEIDFDEPCLDCPRCPTRAPQPTEQIHAEWVWDFQPSLQGWKGEGLMMYQALLKDAQKSERKRGNGS